MQIDWREFYEVVGTLKPYLMEKYLFELFESRVTGCKNFGH